MFGRTLPQARGFSLIEALITLVVMAVGVLALAGMQGMLSHNADVAKQRSEAVRLAQARMEALRAFVSVNDSAAPWSAAPVAEETIAGDTNASFKLGTALGGGPGDPLRAVSVTVRWLDRAGTDAATDAAGFDYNQQVVLSSVISRSDPYDSGLVGNPWPLQRLLRPPRDRHLAIPTPAIDLSNGKSAIQFDANYAVIYDNLSGDVILSCNPGGANATAAQINAALAAGACATMAARTVSGFIGRTGPGIAWPTGINHGALTRNTPDAAQAIRCQFGDAVDPNTGAVITADHGYKYYLCVIPLALPKLWGGTLRLGGVPTSTELIVCRYQYTPVDLTPAQRNLQPYADVNASIALQNHLVTSAADGACPPAMTESGVSIGVLHQDCRSSNAANHATVCPPPSP